MLEVNDIQAFYGASQALFGTCFKVKSGQVVTLMGRNGMGKTTSVHCIMGMLPVREGEVWWEGQKVTNLPSYRVAQMGIGLVPEGRQIFPNLTVRENLVATAKLTNNKARSWSLDRVLDMFPALAVRLKGPGNLLSGGEQQMLAIGRALMTNPRLLILDEATEGLAPLVRRDIWACLAQLKAEGLSILVIDKNVRDLAVIADHHFIIEKGCIVWQGDSRSLVDGSDVMSRYLGF
ncbi:MAG TPA: ABC transporter ATP-binding protein [Gammaproteobacteria bacterium]|nr:ABC transporter ATP-binding protein [Gammaproteobacteria bacterium]